MKNKDLDFQDGIFLNRKHSFNLNTHTLFYHYTSPSGLLGILKKDGVNLRFTRYDCVNDKAEGRNILTCYDKACSELLRDLEIDDDFYRRVKDATIPIEKYFHYRIGESLHLSNDEYKAYICCFSLTADSLPMWNYYVKSGKYQGYNIGIDGRLFTEYLNISSGKGYGFELINVIYDEKEKISILKSDLKEMFKMVNKTRIISVEAIPTFAANIIFNSHLAFKSECFSHEKEIRAIIYVPKQPPAEACDVKKFEIKYRESNGYVVPYIELLCKSKKHIRKIHIGPLAEKEISQSTVQSLLKQREYIAEVINSEIPIRF